MRLLKAMGVLSVLFVLAVGPVRAQVAGWSFNDPSLYGTNDPFTFGTPGDPTDPYVANPFTVASDSGVAMDATFITATRPPAGYAQFGLRDAVTPWVVGDPPQITGGVVFGGRTGFQPADYIGEARLQIHFSQPITSFSLDFLTGAVDPNNRTVAVPLFYQADAVSGSVMPTVANSGGYFQDSAPLVVPLLGATQDLYLWVDPSLITAAPLQLGEFGIDNLRVTAVPEPGALALLLGAGLPFVWRLRRKA